MKILLTLWAALGFHFLAADEPARETSSGTKLVTEPALLCADQADQRIRLVNPEAGKEEGRLLWCYPPEKQAPLSWSPTDAKRVRYEDELFILAACHGRVQLVRFRDSALVKDFPSYPSCHSAELLPDGAIVTANSNDGMLRLHLTADRFEDTRLPYAHGVTWDKKRACLWALGDRLYRFDYLAKKLVQKESFALPLSPTGHDLFPLQDREALLVSNNEALFIFEIAEKKWETISRLPEIKSASQRADGTIWASDPKDQEGMRQWQSNAVMQVVPTGRQRRFTVEGARFYKARWWQEVDFSY
jgi:hypothetical protein